jgi:hypothetical protein
VELKAESPENVSATQGPGPIIDQFTKDEWILPTNPLMPQKTHFNSCNGTISRHVPAQADTLP